MIKIFAVKIKNLNEKLNYNDFHDAICFERIMKIYLCKNNADKKRALVSELLIRKLACDALNRSNCDIDIKVNQYGKPYINNVRNFKFNISHSGSYVIAAISKYKVGIDIEGILPIDLQIAKRFFTENEYNYIDSFDENYRIEAFYKIWTLKESYIKAVGKGLYIPLKSIDFILDNKKIQLIAKDDYGNYEFYNQKINNTYMLAVCHQEKEIDRQINYIDEYELYNYFGQQ